MKDDLHIKNILNSLNERKKELNCIYRISEILNSNDQPLDEAFNKVIAIIPFGWQYSDICSAQIVYNDQIYQTPGLTVSSCKQESMLIIDGKQVGNLRVFYDLKAGEEYLFLEEEQRLLNTIAEKISVFLHRKKLMKALADLEQATQDYRQKPEWQTIIELLRRTDADNYLRIARKLMNYLFWIGRTDTECPPAALECKTRDIEPEFLLFTNKPIDRQDKDSLLEQSRKIFLLAENNLDDDEILLNIQKWLQEDKVSF